MSVCIDICTDIGGPKSVWEKNVNNLISLNPSLRLCGALMSPNVVVGVVVVVIIIMRLQLKRKAMKTSTSPKIIGHYSYIVVHAHICGDTHYSSSAPPAESYLERSVSVLMNIIVWSQFSVVQFCGLPFMFLLFLHTLFDENTWQQYVFHQANTYNEKDQR